MMKNEVRKSFEKHGEFLCINEIAEVMNIDRGTARGLLYGLPHIPLGRKKLYHISDIADRIMERKKA